MFVIIAQRYEIKLRNGVKGRGTKYLFFLHPVRRRESILLPADHPAYRNEKTFQLGRQSCTRVPIGSPSITFFRFPTVSISNTMSGRPFSLHIVVAVRSITFRLRR